MTINYNHTARIIPELINGNKELILSDILVSKENLKNFIERDSYSKVSNDTEYGLTLKELSEEKYETGTIYYVEFFDNYIGDQDDSRIIVIALNKGKIRYFRVDAKNYLYEIDTNYLTEELVAKLDGCSKEKVVEVLKNMLLENIIKVPVGISNHHVHLTKEDLEILFGKGFELEVDHALSQKGQFASKQKVKIKSEYGEIDNMRVLGPVRSYTQVEISKTDSYKLKLTPPVRESGDLNNSCGITIIGPKGEVNKEFGCIIADRHIHLNNDDLNRYGLDKNKLYRVKITGEKGGILDNVHLKVDENFTFELHLDTDDANAFLLKQGDEIEIIK